MPTNVYWSQRAIRDVQRLDRQVREGLIAAVERFAETGQGDVIRLTPPLAGYRLRYRDWRVSFERDAAEGTITVRRVRHRREAYRER